MKTISIKWSTDDVLDTAESMDIELTEQEADKILDEMERCHDAELGINWLVIESYIESFIQMKEDKEL
jgi:Ca2+-binding EF-hand superfamily protein